MGLPGYGYGFGFAKPMPHHTLNRRYMGFVYYLTVILSLNTSPNSNSFALKLATHLFIRTMRKS
jgi:hypothetical protein